MSPSLRLAGSPSSIPSSPTSVHSSSSAIFERDIEPLSSPSPPSSAHPPNPHRTPRSKELDHAVPSVLDSAAEILTASPSSDSSDIAVLAPAPDHSHGHRSGVASPIGSLRSRSPSPQAHPTRVPAQRSTLLLNIPSPTHHQLPLPNLPHIGTPAPYVGPVVPPTATFPQTSASPSFPPNTTGPSPVSPTRPLITTTADLTPDDPPSIITPTSAYFSTTSSVPPDSPTTTTRENPPHALPASPPSPTHQATTSATKRLSFMSYSDLLTSTPSSTLPLSSLTTSASNEPPPHIPSVCVGGGQGLGSPGGAGSGAASIHGGRGRDRDSVATDDVGGEWEREGLGKGLEERLEALMVGKA